MRAGPRMRVRFLGPVAPAVAMLLLAVVAATAMAENNGLGITPPMGTRVLCMVLLAAAIWVVFKLYLKSSCGHISDMPCGARVRACVCPNPNPNPNPKAGTRTTT